MIGPTCELDSSGKLVYSIEVSPLAVAEAMRKVDRDLKSTQRGLERDRAKLEREEQRLVSPAEHHRQAAAHWLLDSVPLF